MTVSLLVYGMLALPLVAGLVCLFATNRDVMLRLIAIVTGAFVIASILLIIDVFTYQQIARSKDELLRVDGFSAFHIVTLGLTHFGASLFAIGYFRREMSDGQFTLRQAQRYGALWLASLSSMLLVLVSNNVGMMWVGMETTTIATAYIVGMHGGSKAIEAMWKYLIVCSVGVAFAFMGTLLCAAAAQGSTASPQDTLLWTHLIEHRASLNPKLMRIAFIFLVVGYGTKAGLAPMHTWLPDAHSQAPAPVSAMFSGFMLNAALYCAIRYLPLIEATSPGFGVEVLLGFGVISVLISAIFLIFQTDAKRMLAYCSVEHIGLITIGYALGPVGAFAALFHTINHSLAKSLAFFSVGRLGQLYGSHDMTRIRGAIDVSPVYGTALLTSILALIGVAPFALFVSEFQIVRAMFHAHSFGLMVTTLAALAVIFGAMLQRVIGMAFGEAPRDVARSRARPAALLLTGSYIVILLALGLWMPPVIRDAIVLAVHAVGTQQ